LSSFSSFTTESIIEKTYSSQNLPYPLFACPWQEKDAKEGKFLPFAKGGKEGFSLQSHTIMAD
jgi:hypothetical protein